GLRDHARSARSLDAGFRRAARLTGADRADRADTGASAKPVELEDPAIPGDLCRPGQVDLIGDANELDAEAHRAGEGPEDVTKEHDALRLIELGGAHVFVLAPHGDRRASRGAQVPDPLDVAPGSPHPAPARDFDDRDGRRPGRPLSDSTASP